MPFCMVVQVQTKDDDWNFSSVQLETFGYVV